MNLKPTVIFCALLLLCCALPLRTAAQMTLYKRVSLHADSVRVADALSMLARGGKFNFSYNSRLVDAGERITLHATDEPLHSVLDRMFNYRLEYKETGGYIVLRQRLQQMSFDLEDMRNERNRLIISGFVYDATTRRVAPNVSVYERNRRIATLTDANGYFTLRVKDAEQSTALTFSKQNYRDTSVFILGGITIKPGGSSNTDHYDDDGNPVEQSFWGNLLISSRQRIHSLNLGNPFASSPMQLSLLPGVSTQGIFSSQTVNLVSFNLLGGYTAGVNGVEAGTFNINKKEMSGLQGAALFNVVGGGVSGLQAAGIYSLVFGDVGGMQASGIFNIARNVGGMQAAGIFNLSRNTTTGIQASGIVSVSQAVVGFQGSGIVNITGGAMRGAQLAGIVNINAGGEYLQRGMDIAENNAVSERVSNIIRGDTTSSQPPSNEEQSEDKPPFVSAIKGLQVATIANLNESNTKLLQISFCANVDLHETHGVQVGLANYSGALHGVQIGVVNVAGDMRGCSVGLLNVFRKRGRWWVVPVVGF